MTKMTKTSWYFIDLAIDNIIIKLKPYKKITGVYGVPRGGLIPAVMLSHRLDVPLLMAPTKGCVVIDDICESGQTMDSYGNYENNKIIKVCLFLKNKNNKKINIYYKKTKDWIIFPWEKNE